MKFSFLRITYFAYNLLFTFYTIYSPKKKAILYVRFVCLSTLVLFASLFISPGISFVFIFSPLFPFLNSSFFFLFAYSLYLTFAPLPPFHHFLPLLCLMLFPASFSFIHQVLFFFFYWAVLASISSYLCVFRFISRAFESQATSELRTVICRFTFFLLFGGALHSSSCIFKNDCVVEA